MVELPELLKTVLSTVSSIGVGVISGLFFNKLLKKKTFGDIWGAMIVGVLGSVLGGLVLDKIILFLLEVLAKNPLDLNFIGAFIGAFVLVWLLSKISEKL